MIYVTGDTHGKLDLSKIKVFCLYKKLTKKDYIIIAGDCGVVWSPKTIQEDIKLYQDLACTILFIDGNHENFDMLNQYTIEIWNNGKIHRIADSVYHLMRGQVFMIDGIKIFTMGGAQSIDKFYRTENISWWPEEIPSYADLDEADKNLEKVNYCVDYVITHTCDTKTFEQLKLPNKRKANDPTMQLLDYFEEKVTYKHWYFGHFHDDDKVSTKKTCLYYEIVQLDN